MSDQLPATTDGRTRPLVRITSEVIDKITDMVRRGNKRSIAAMAVGISAPTLAKWMKRGEAGELPYSDLFMRVSQAEAMSADDAMQAVLEIAKDKDVEPQHRLKGLTFVLERAYDYAAKSEVSVETSTKDGDGREPNYGNLSPELLEVFEFCVRLLEAGPTEVSTLMQSAPPWLNLPKAEIVDAEFEVVTVAAEEVPGE